ncbi:MAG: acyltransferase [Flavobacteriaceae bacterium]
MKKKLNFIEFFFYKTLISLANKLRDYTYAKYSRVNPFIEDLTDWKERGKYLFGKENVTVYGSSNISGNIEVGENTWIGPYTALDGSGGLIIGKNCSISSKVNIVSHDTIKWALSGGLEGYEHAPIRIGDNCFIGTGAFIGKGVSIGNNCLVAANSVVTNDFDDFSIIGGIPGKKIGKVLVTDDKKVKLVFNSDSNLKNT